MSMSALKTGCDRGISERRKGLVSIHGALPLSVCLPAVHIPLQWPSLHQGGLVSTGQIHTLLGGSTPSQGQRESYRSNEKVLIQIYNEIPTWDKASGQRIDTRTSATAAIMAVNSNTMMKVQSVLPCRNNMRKITNSEKIEDTNFVSHFSMLKWFWLSKLNIYRKLQKYDFVGWLKSVNT